MKPVAAMAVSFLFGCAFYPAPTPDPHFVPANHHSYAGVEYVTKKLHPYEGVEYETKCKHCGKEPLDSIHDWR